MIVVVLFSAILISNISSTEIHKTHTRITSEKIINGHLATVGQFPWQVAIISNGFFKSSICGGSLISDVWILTAAHCLISSLFLTLHLGGLTLNTEEPNKIITQSISYLYHPGYNDYLNNDVGLIRMQSSIRFNENIYRIRLPTKNSYIPPGVTVRVSGWGKVNDSAQGAANDLYWTDLQTISNEECIKVYDDKIIISSTLCAVGNPNHSTCNGDSGGPLITIDEDGGYTLHGVVSFVHILGCSKGQPSGYTRTASMLEWITMVTGIKT